MTASVHHQTDSLPGRPRATRPHRILVFVTAASMAVPMAGLLPSQAMGLSDPRPSGAIYSPVSGLSLAPGVPLAFAPSLYLAPPQQPTGAARNTSPAASTPHGSSAALGAAPDTTTQCFLKSSPLSPMASSHPVASAKAPELTLCQSSVHGLGVALISPDSAPATAHILLSFADTLWSIAITTRPPGAAIRSHVLPKSSSDLSIQKILAIAADTTVPERDPATLPPFRVAIPPFNGRTALEVDAPASATLISVEWTSSSGHWIGILARTGASGAVSDAAPSSHWSVMGTLSANTPDPFAGPPGLHAAAGAIITHTGESMNATLALAPPALLAPLNPLVADPNRRYAREAPDARPEMQFWRNSALPILLVDTRRVDRTLGFLEANVPQEDAHAIGAIGADGHPTFMAFGVGDGTVQPLAIRVAALRSQALSAAGPLGNPSGPQGQTWTAVLGFSGGWGKSADAPAPVAVDSLASRSSVSSPFFRWEWDATGSPNYPRSRAEAVHLSGGIPLAFMRGVPLLNVLAPSTFTVNHDRLAPGFSSLGASWAPIDGATVTHMGLMRPVRADTIMLAANIQTPEYRFDIFRPVPLGAGREIIAGLFLTHPTTHATWTVEAAMHHARLDTLDFGASPIVSLGLRTQSGWSGDVHAEGTPLYQTLAPGRVVGASLARTWSAPSVTLSALATGGVAWQCGQTLLRVSRFLYNENLAPAPWTGGCQESATSAGAGVLISSTGRRPFIVELRATNDTHRRIGSITQLVPRFTWSTPLGTLGTLVTAADCPGDMATGVAGGAAIGSRIGSNCQATITFARMLKP